MVFCPQARTLLCWILLVPTVTADDLRIVQRDYGDGGVSHDTRYFLKGERRRVELRHYLGGRTLESFIYGPHLAVIYQCDLDRTVYLNLDTRRYFVTPANPFPIPKGSTAAPVEPAPPPKPEGPQIRQSSLLKIEETSNRRLFHGREAWLVRETEDRTSTLGARVDKYSSVTETWYIDLDAPMDCFKPLPGMKYEDRLVAGNGLFEQQIVGSARRGYAISTKRMFKSDLDTSTFLTEVVDFSEQPLESNLFEIPADFTETKRWEDIYPPLQPRLRWWESVIVWFYRLVH